MVRILEEMAGRVIHREELGAGHGIERRRAIGHDEFGGSRAHIDGGDDRRDLGNSGGGRIQVQRINLPLRRGREPWG